ncbi:glycosyltransferase family 2 protein [Microbacterium esteraromaticum]|uniref:glycosyltransferase n=1 Tax=Microbacterium esteraromaticum TaxID=57043 RepID=UPI0023683869|nr:glycosyltransferase family 2 protein [Microbacterium esteraromaticum]WDH79822.1 glycosyltransferase family 2 protein [Microbacterium esteraromaticum]
MVAVSVIVPTYNEGPNVAPLVARLSVLPHIAEIIFVDDSTDDTPAEIERIAAEADVHVQLLHREEATGGLGGAVLCGFDAATSDVCVVMDGDLQHPPEVIPQLIGRYDQGETDVVVASRYAGEGSAAGLAGFTRVAVSRGSTLLTKAMFPRRLYGCSDPMTGFFLVDLKSIDRSVLRPQGFKILLEILARHTLRIAEVSFDFADRNAGESKASLKQGIRFLRQLSSLRFGKMPAFALVGGIGAVVNVFIVWLLTALEVGYLWAAIVGAEITIVGNFLILDRYVFSELKAEAAPFWRRFSQSFLFNNAEAMIRIPVMALLVESWHISAALATAATLAVAFVVRFVFHSLVVYRPRPSDRTGRALKETAAATTPSGAEA